MSARKLIVWIVGSPAEDDRDSIGGQILGVFSTEIAARDYAATFTTSPAVEEWEVDS